MLCNICSTMLLQLVLITFYHIARLLYMLYYKITCMLQTHIFYSRKFNKKLIFSKYMYHIYSELQLIMVWNLQTCTDIQALTSIPYFL